ncbi:hypothetical protein Q3G72_028778 [Acer saccharum]|nr:hypothetical protein Q3G72_028778 [Acer saccharum]
MLEAENRPHFPSEWYSIRAMLLVKSDVHDLAPGPPGGSTVASFYAIDSHVLPIRTEIFIAVELAIFLTKLAIMAQREMSCSSRIEVNMPN